MIGLRFLRGPAAAAALLISFCGSTAAQDLSNQSFTLRYDGTGVRSLKRTADKYDTDYIAANAALGRLLIRYRSAPNGDWHELRDPMPIPNASHGAVEYVLGILQPTLASKASPAAARGAGGLRALNDGILPSGGFGRGRSDEFLTFPGFPVQEVPTFTFPTGAVEPGSGGTDPEGATRWVQYTFPTVEQISRSDVFWVVPPKAWRILYQEGGQWKPVSSRGTYGVTPNTMASIEFDPVMTNALRLEATMEPNQAASIAEWQVGDPASLSEPEDLQVKESFELEGDALNWTITLTNKVSRPVEIGDLGVPLLFAERTPPRSDIYTKKLLRHALVAEYGSFVYWQRSNGEGPYLVMTPTGEAKFEYSENFSPAGGYTAYVHSKAVQAAAKARGGNWRFPATAVILAPKGAPGSTRTYTFRFRWAKDFASVRDVLYDEGKFDTSVVPGMVVPSDLSAMFSLRTKNTITAVQPEYVATTRIEPLGEKPGGYKVYRVRFSKLGENMLRVKYGNGRWTALEFFVTEPLETVIRKRAAFLINTQQHKDPSKWYDGVYSDWDEKNEILRSPEDRDGLSAWLTDADDDAGNARPAFIASKNVFLPDQAEIASVEAYIEKYLWGGMQKTEKEKYPYAIYGIPNFMANRSSVDTGRNGQAHVWRIYDYPHIIMLYYRMYQIAKFYPSRVKYLDAKGYLERAYRTAVAYWTVPMEVEKWSADSVGTMNEAFIPELIQSLEEESHPDWAKTLRGYWEGKVDRFVNHTPNLYGSEFSFDSTGFESTGAFAKYAVTRNADDFRAKVSLDAAKKFQDFQLLLNMTDRGWLETNYYLLGSDYRGGMSYLLSYMSQMGGWSILDYGLYFAADPTDYLRLGYASSLSSWALVNSGTRESGYGYWFPSKANDGATAGGFMADAIGRGWIGKEMPRGAWHYSAEEDVGYCGALRTHGTIVAKDPVFGEFAYGGVLTRTAGAVSVVPRDGLRVRFHVIRGDQRFHLLLDHDGYAKEQPVIVADDLSRVQFILENRTGGSHSTELTIAGLPAGSYTITVDGKMAGTVKGSVDQTKVVLPVGASPSARVEIRQTTT
jgi:hypothetical protein